MTFLSTIRGDDLDTFFDVTGGFAQTVELADGSTFPAIISDGQDQDSRVIEARVKLSDAVLYDLQHHDVVKIDSDEFVGDPSFASGAAWSAGTGWTVFGGIALCSGAQVSSSTLSQIATSEIVAGRQYEYTVVVTAATAGSFRVSAGGGLGDPISTAGTHTGVVTATLDSIVAMVADADFTGAISDLNIAPAQCAYKIIGFKPQRLAGNPLLPNSDGVLTLVLSLLDSDA